MSTQKTIPASALRFAAALAVSRKQSQGDSEAEVFDVKITARTGQPTTHPYWGRVVHDFAGMVAADRIPIDYNHDAREILGFADNPQTRTGDLVLSGHLTPFKHGDRVDEIISKAAAGVPYQASIFFGGEPLVLEEVPEGYETDVNGYRFEGPGTVIRQWPLRGVAILPYGQDANTAVEFAAGKNQTVNVTQGGKPVAAPRHAEPAAVQKERETARQFVAAFGPQGALWAIKGKTFEEAHALFAAKVSAVRDTAARMEQDKAQAERVEQFKAAGLSDGMARFAASIKVR